MSGAIWAMAVTSAMGMWFKRQDEAEDGEHFAQGAQHHPGIERLGQFADEPHGEDHRQAPQAGGDAAHDQHLKRRRIRQCQLHAAVIGHEGAGSEQTAPIPRRFWEKCHES